MFGVDACGWPAPGIRSAVPFSAGLPLSACKTQGPADGATGLRGYDRKTEVSSGGLLDAGRKHDEAP